MSDYEITYAKGVSLQDWLELTGKNDKLVAKVKELEEENARLNNILWGMDVEIENETHFYFEGYVLKSLLPSLVEKAEGEKE